MSTVPSDRRPTPQELRRRRRRHRDEPTLSLGVNELPNETRTPVECLVDQVVEAQRALQELRAKREEACALLVDADRTLERAIKRERQAWDALNAHIHAQASSPL